MEYNKNFRLQLRHGMEERIFPDRDAAIKYIEGVLSFSSFGKEELLLPYEPVLFFYGEGDDKKAIVMVGLPDGTKYDGKPYFLIDTAYLEEKIDAEDSRHTAIEEKLEQEIQDRKAAIEAEAKAREEGDKELSDAISAEAKTREEEDGKLATSISEEETARIKAVEEEAKAREEADDTEKTARIEMDDELKAAIDYNKDDIKGIIEACGIIYNDKMSSDRVSYSPDTHDEVIRDAKSVAEAVDKVSKFAAKIASDLKISVENTDTVDLTMSEDTKNGGSVIKADVNIAGSDGLSKKTFDNNIMGKTSDGLYAAASIEPSATNPNMLVFKTSGYVDGQFKVDAYETEVPLAQYSGDDGKKTGVDVSVDEDKNVISAQLNLSSDAANILKLEDGEYIVDGHAKNIIYKEGTVAQALNKQANEISDIKDAVEFVKNIDVKGGETETSSVSVSKNTKGDFTVTNDVKLSTDKSIIIANGGLSANVKASYSSGTSTLLIEVGNNSYKIDLSELAVSVLKSASYDSVTEEVVLTFIVGDSEKTLRIPVGTLIHDIAVDDTDTIDMTLTSVAGGPNRISAELKVDKTHSDNILTVTSSGAYVSKAYITDAVKEESDARKDADNAIKTTLDEVSKLAAANKENLASEINRATKAEEKNAAAIAQEIIDARAAEKVNSDAIAENKTAIDANKDAIADEVTRAKKAEQANTDAITTEETRAKEAEAKNENAITFEVNRATEKEADLLEKIGTNSTAIGENKTAIAQEIKDARAAEKKNADAIVDEVTRATAAETANEKSISEEVIRAKAAEEANATAILKESERATTAENGIIERVTANEGDIADLKTLANNTKSNLDAEISRAKTAESELSNKVTVNSDDILTLNANVSTLGTNLTEEITRAKAAESANATAVVTEKERALAAEGELLGKVTTNTSDITKLSATVSSHTDAINTEVTRATAAENKLISDLSAEVTRATNAEDKIAANVTANATSINTLNDKVGTLESNLSVETERAQKAEKANATAIETETNRATEKEGDLLEKIEKNTSDISTISTNIGNIELKKEGELSYALYVNGTKHGEFSIPQDQFLKNVNYDATAKKLIFVFNTASGDVTSEISIADLVDTYTNGEGLSLSDNVFSVDFSKVASVDSVSNAVAVEKARAEQAEGTLTQNVTANKGAIDAEVTRATAAERANADAIAQEIKDARSAEAANAKAITDETARAKAAENTNSEAIKLEVNTARANESTLSTAIETEANRAKAAEKVNTDAIAAEETRATKAESELKGSINTNTTSINGLKTSVEALTTNLKNETERATGKETELLGKINENATKITTISTSVDGIELKKESELSYALYVKGTKHGEFSIPKDQFLKSVNYDATAKKLIFVFSTTEGDVTSEVSIADLVDTYTNGEGLLMSDNVFSVDFSKVASVDSVSNAVAVEKARAEAKEGTIAKDVASNKSAIAAEETRATKAEAELKTSIKDNTESIGTINTTLGTLGTNLTNEIERAKEAEKGIDTVSSKVDSVKAELTTEIDKKANSVDVYTKNEVTEKLGDYAKTADVTELLEAKANTADVANVYATKEELQGVKDAYATVKSVNALETSLSGRIDTNATSIDNFGLTYNAANSTLTYTNKNGVATDYKLYSGTLVEEGYFDEKTNSIVLVVKNGETESKITIPVTELLSDVDARITENANSIASVKTDMSKLAKDWTVASSSTVELTKSTAGEKDSLTASVKVASSNKQAIQSKDNGLYVSNDLQDFTVVYGSTGTISAQDAISKLLESTSNNATKISALSEEVKTYSKRIENLETDSSVLKERVELNATNIASISSRQNDVEKKMDETVTTVDTYSNRISTLEDSVKKVEDNIGEIDIKSMSDAIETIKTDLIGDKTNPKEGTIWYAINNLIDAGKY